jgi:hypothetical protein
MRRPGRLALGRRGPAGGRPSPRVHRVYLTKASTQDAGSGAPRPGRRRRPPAALPNESASALTATIVEVRAAWRMHPTQRFEVAPLAGSLHQNFSYRASDTNQL